MTDRVDPKRVYLFGVAATVLGHLMFALFADGFWSALAMRALTGMGWAGTYMTGLKLLADRVDAKMMSRATAGHAASIGISGALSFATGDLIAAAAGWRAAFFVAAMSAAVAWLAGGPDRSRAKQARRSSQRWTGSLRFSARVPQPIGYGLCDCLLHPHAGDERVARMGRRFPWICGNDDRRERAQCSRRPSSPPDLGLIGTAASVAGNEAAIRFGRKRLIVTAMLASILLGGTIGFLGSTSYALAVVLITLYGVVIWLDSSSLTAGTAGTAEPSRRGATLAVHSMLGYAGGFVGPLLIGWTLDLSGGMSPIGWGMSFLSVAMLMVLALITFWLIRPRELEGDRSKAS